MRLPFGSIYFLLIIFLAFSMSAKADNIGHEKSTYKILDSSNNNRAPHSFGAFAVFLIDFYQRKISPQSTHRCLFSISCSNYAEKSILQDGFLFGTSKFIDRYYFREHKYAWLYYPRVETADGILRLDDSYYLSGEKERKQIESGGQGTDAGIKKNKSYKSFGDMLFKERDWERAITAYKEQLFFTSDPNTISYCRHQIGRSYFALNNFTQCSIWTGLYLQESAESEVEIADGHRLLGLNYARQYLFPLAEAEFNESVKGDTTDISRLYRFWICAEKREWDDAYEGLSIISKNAEWSVINDIANNWVVLISQRRYKRYKSPSKAAFLSTLIPGLGQAYSGHFFDAMQAIAYCSIFTLATTAAYKYESSTDKPRVLTTTLGSITAMFHFANIWGAHRTAQYRNHRIDYDVLQHLRHSASELELNRPPP